MRIVDLVSLAVGNIARSRLRTTLTSLAVVVAAFTLTLTAGVGAGISRYIADTLDSIGGDATMELTKPLGDRFDGPPEYQGASGVRGDFGASNQTLMESDLDAVRALPGVTGVEPTLPVTTAFIQVQGESQRFASGLSALSGDRIVQVAEGRLPRAGSHELVIPATFVDAVGFNGAELPVRIGFHDARGIEQAIEATVVGSIQASLAPDRAPVATAQLVEAIFGAQVEGLTEQQLPQPATAMVSFDPDLTAAEIAALQSDLEQLGLQGTTTADRLGLFQTVIDAVTWVLIGFAVLALIAASFGIVNTLLMSVQERTSEIGLLKAHGMTPSRLFGLFSLEALSIGAIGAVVGSALAIAVGSIADSLLVNGALSALPGMRAFAVDPLGQGVIVAIVLLVAVAAGTIPAARAARKDPIAALRHE